MKRKEITVTVLACAALIAAGTFAFSLLYKTLFRPDAVIGDYSEDPTWLEEQARYEKAVLCPLSFALESGVIEKTDGSDMHNYLNFCINSLSVQNTYSSTLRLRDLLTLIAAGLECAMIGIWPVSCIASRTGQNNHLGIFKLFHADTSS